MGNAAARSSCILGAAIERCARVRAPCRQLRSENGGVARRHAARMEARQALRLQRRGDRCVADGSAMTDLRSALDKYLSMRKGLGYKYEHQTRRLADFVAFMEKRKARIITTKLAMEWATLPPDRHASW